MMFSLQGTCMKTSFFFALILVPLQGWADHHATEALQTHIQSLAASCAACHGTNGNSVGITPLLAGLDTGYFITQMQAFKNNHRQATVMHRHAKGLTDEEINALAQYFYQQPRLTPHLLKHQTLRRSHD
jgi:cytochrome c553